MTPRLIVYCARGIGNEPHGLNVHPISATFDRETKSAVITACALTGQERFTFKWQHGKVFDASGEYIAFIASQLSPKIYEVLAMTPEWTV